MPIHLDTSSLETILPGIENEFGKEKAVSINVKLTDIGNFTISEATQYISFEADIQLEFMVGSSLAVDMTLEHTKIISNI